MRKEIYDAVRNNTEIVKKGSYITTFANDDDAEEFRAFLHRHHLRPGKDARLTYWVNGGNTVHWVTDEDKETGDNPVEGGLATFTVYTDSYACDVVKVTPKTATLRVREAIIVRAGAFQPGGFSAVCTTEPKWASLPDPNGKLMKVSERLRANNTAVWKKAGHPTRSPGNIARFGAAHYHYDYGF